MDSVKTGDNNNIAKLTDKANSNSENQDYLFFFLFFFPPCVYMHITALIVFWCGSKPLLRSGTHLDHTHKKSKEWQVPKTAYCQLSPAPLSQKTVGYLGQLPHSKE